MHIGKYVQIAQGVQFITSGANHQMDGFSAYPFAIFGGRWASGYEPHFPNKGDTVIDHDVWLGHEALVMPGVHIGSGAIIGARSVVTKDVPPYWIAAGNPARNIKPRCCEETIKTLLNIAWWDWDSEKVERNIAAIVGGGLRALLQAK